MIFQYKIKMLDLLDVKYEKDAEKQYAVLEGQESEEYGMKMLLNNKMQGILDVQVKTIDNQKKYYYNITKQSSLEQLLEKKQVTLELMEQIFIQIFQVMDTAKKFLLDEKNLVLETKMIYLSGDNPKKVEICYYPSYQQDSMEQLIALLEVFLNEIDYKKEKKEKIEQFYKIYDKARENGMTCRELQKELQKEYKQETPPFHFEGLEQKKLQEQTESDLLENNQEREVLKSNPLGENLEQGTQKTYFWEKKTEKATQKGYPWEKKTEKEAQKSYPWEKNQEKEVQKSYSWEKSLEQEEPKKSASIRTILPFCFIILFTGVVIGTALCTNIFHNVETGALEYEKLGILCIVVAAMDFGAWKYFNQTDSETAEFSDHTQENSGLIENEFWKEAFAVGGVKEQGQEIPEVGVRKQEISELQKREISGVRKQEISKLQKWEMSEKGVQKQEKFWKTEIEETDEEFAKTEMPEMEKRLIETELQEIEEGETQLLIEEPTMLLEQEETVLLQPKEKLWCLISLKGKKTTEIILEKFPFYVGKTEWNVDYAIDHPSISRIHSKFEKEEEHLYVTDLDSTNGTYLNHIPLKRNEKQEVKAGDEISFADMKFRLEEV